jgi:hypothetical protein
MPRERLTFRQRDVAAAVRALRQAGLHVTQVKITPDGEIVVSTSEDASVELKKNPWDKYYANPPKLREKL